MLGLQSLALVALLPLAFTAPTPDKVLAPRATQCGQWDSVKTGGFTLYADLWNMNAGTGSQCSEATAASATSISWYTTWTWSGGAGQVKSYTNAVYTMSAKQISAISSMATTWKWTYTGSNIIANVAYDMFLSSTATGSNQYEVMIWLGALGGAGPISSTGKAIASPNIGGTTFDLYYGLNGAMKVYSFVAQSKSVTSYSGDLKAFFTYLSSSQGVSSSLYLLSTGAGTEPFSGSGAKLTNTYTLTVK